MPSRHGGGPAGLWIDAVVTRPPAGCPTCGGGLHAHDTRSLAVADEPRHGRPVRLHVTYRRYRCVACGASCTDVPDILAAGRRMTRLLVAYIEARSFTVPVDRLASETGLAASSVAGLVEAHVDALEAACRPRATAVLGLDEVHLGRAAVGVAGHYRKRGMLVITAPEGNRMLAVGADTRRATVEAELRGLADLDRVRIVTMDMTPHYRAAVRAVLPGATIVADRWHVQKLFVEALQEARKRFLRTAPAPQGAAHPGRPAPPRPSQRRAAGARPAAGGAAAAGRGVPPEAELRRDLRMLPHLVGGDRRLRRLAALVPASGRRS